LIEHEPMYNNKFKGQFLWHYQQKTCF